MYASLGLTLPTTTSGVRRPPLLSTCVPTTAIRRKGMRDDQVEHYLKCRPKSVSPCTQEVKDQEGRCFEEAMMLPPSNEVIEEALRSQLEKEQAAAGRIPRWAYYAGAALGGLAVYRLVLRRK